MLLIEGRCNCKACIVTFTPSFPGTITILPPSQHVIISNIMEQSNIIFESEIIYPVLLIPKRCTTLETAVTGNVLINLNITSPDTEGNEMCIYTGFCNVKILNSYDVNVQPPANHSGFDNVQSAPVETENQVAYPSYSQSQVWIDPVRSPHVYNQSDTAVTLEHSACRQTRSGQITVQQHNTYITQNVYNYQNSIHYASVEDSERIKLMKLQADTVQPSTSDGFGFECEVEINEKETKAKEELKYIDFPSESKALKQLMSSDIQSSRQRKSYFFPCDDSHRRQTAQKMAADDPSLVGSGDGNNDHEVGIDDVKPHQQNDECDEGELILDNSPFNQHIGSHGTSTPSTSISKVKFKCTECGKRMKNRRKFQLHRKGHGDPDLECSNCHKVFASKYTLRTHSKIHNREHVCLYCSKTYDTLTDLFTHSYNTHFFHECVDCDYKSKNLNDLKAHKIMHMDLPFSKEYSDNDITESLIDEVISDANILVPSPEDEEKFKIDDYVLESLTNDEIEKADMVIAQVMSNKLFLLHTRKAGRHERLNRACNVCLKSFYRVGDLKRHLIEHIIRSTLAKNPVSKNGTLKIQCVVCQVETFNKIDRYKAHLREHAKLTLYQCTFCDKSFSDSSNFSKHKKIHGSRYFQCDLCQRKFTSKKMITIHMEYHNKNSPTKCEQCDKVFYFESMLNRHVKFAHTKEICNRFRCKFCHIYFKTLKEKWDHEWTVHNVRKMIVDCLICGSKFRKYLELKRHCIEVHNMEIPTAKKLLRKKKNN